MFSHKKLVVVVAALAVLNQLPILAQQRAGGIDQSASFPSALQKSAVAPLSEFMTITQQGDYVAAGVGMRGTGAGSIVITGIPAGSTVSHAFLYWVVLDSVLGDSFDDGLFGGAPIVGRQVGNDVSPCWETFGATQTFAFRADVTALVPGNGTYDLSGFASGPPTPMTEFGEAVSLPLNEGATLVVVYRDPSLVVNRDIVIYDGAVTLSGSLTSSSTTMTVPPIGVAGDAKTTYVVADGQDHGSDATIFNGTALANDGSATSESFEGSDGQLWDTDTYDVASLVTTGDESVTTEIRKGTDCLVHVAQIFSATSSTPLPLTCELEITSPTKGAFLCSDSVDVTVLSRLSGGVQPAQERTCAINGVPATFVNDSLSVARIPVNMGLNVIQATCTFIDQQGAQTTCSDQIIVNRAQPPSATIDLLSPTGGAVVCGDSVRVLGFFKVISGVPPVEFQCEVNGITVSVPDTTFTITLPLDLGDNTIVATCTVLDSCGNQTVVSDTVVVTAPTAPVCTVEISSPLDGSIACGDTLRVTGTTSIEGGAEPFMVTCTVNGVTAVVDSDGAFTASVPLVIGTENEIVAMCTVVDSCGGETVCTDTVVVSSPALPVCSVEITSPADSSTFCGDSLQVTGVTSIEDGFEPFEISCDINGIPTELDASGGFVGAIPILQGQNNTIIATCTIVDSCGNQTVCADTITVLPPAPPVCTVEITSPADSSVACGDSLKVTGVTSIDGDFGPFSVMCDVNGVAANLDSDGVFMATVPLLAGENQVIATCTVVDSCGNQTVCADTLTVLPPVPPVCTVAITSPADSSVACGDSLKVTGVTSIDGDFGPFSVTCDVNGVAASLDSDGVFMATVPLLAGENQVIATCTVVDSCGNETVCADTVTVLPPPPPLCTVEITSPADSSIVCGDSLKVTGVTTIEGGLGPFSVICNVNGVATVVDGTGGFMATIPLDAGSNTIIATCTFVDSCGNETVCADTVLVLPPPLPACQVTITAPADSSFLCGDSLTLAGFTAIESDFGPFTVSCDVNGVPLNVDADGNFLATLSSDIVVDNLLVVTCTVVDSCGGETVCADSVVVQPPPPPVAAVQITSPEEGTIICTDSVTVTGVTSIQGDFPPFTVVCAVNGFAATVDPQGSFVAVVPFDPTNASLVATCTVTDSCGSQVTSSDSVTVEAPPAPAITVEITSPQDDAVFCDRQIEVEARTTITAGLPPFQVTCDINGQVVTVVNNIARATVNLKSKNNLIVAVCTVVDSCGNTATSRDSISVFLDTKPPDCTFEPSGSSITGTFIDKHSGIAQIVPQSLRNANLTVDPFTPGAREVGFRLDPIDPNKAISFLIDAIDVCGNKFQCDPVFLNLSADRTRRQAEFSFPDLDRYLKITNRGLTEIQVDLNGQKFKLTSHPGLVVTEWNAFDMPEQGRLTIDLVDYLDQGENRMSVSYNGPAGSSADFILIDVADEVDFVLELQALAEDFALAQNFPNPFNPTTKIRFDLPASTDGVPVRLAIYNLLGELVRVLVDEEKFPGQYFVEWDGRDQSGRSAPSGIYVYQLRAGDFRETRRMLLLK